MPMTGYAALSYRHPLARLKKECEAAKVPIVVRRQIRSLFRAIENPKDLTQEQAEFHARRLFLHVQLLRCRYELSRISPADKGYFQLSKAAAMYLFNLEKLSSRKQKSNGRQPTRRPVPTAALRPNDEGEHGAGEDDGETA